jgi:predicted  nucleic acid-binding Zn-ribbon protein
LGKVHRALRESVQQNEERLGNMHTEIADVTSSLDTRIEHATRRMHQEHARTEGAVADLEELVLQIYEDHEAALGEERRARDAARAELVGEQAAHRAALITQQEQIEALTTAMRKQQEVIDHFMRGTAAQMSAVQAETSELHKAFRAQGAAMQATKDYISSIDAKLSEQLEERVRAAEAASTAAAASWEVRHAEHRMALERLLSVEPQVGSRRPGSCIPLPSRRCSSRPSPSRLHVSPCRSVRARRRSGACEPASTRR